MTQYLRFLCLLKSEFLETFSMRNITLLTIGLIIVCFAGTCMYFVVGVSSTSPPIKKYKYLGSIDQLIHGIQKYSSSDTNVTIKITD